MKVTSVEILSTSSYFNYAYGPERWYRVTTRVRDDQGRFADGMYESDSLKEAAAWAEDNARKTLANMTAPAITPSPPEPAPTQRDYISLQAGMERKNSLWQLDSIQITITEPSSLNTLTVKKELTRAIEDALDRLDCPYRDD